MNSDLIPQECNILITGATGYIGGLLIDELLELNRHNNYNINITALSRDERKTRARWKDSAVRHIEIDITDDNFVAIVADKVGGLYLGYRENYIIHCASPTKSHFILHNPVETADAIVLGTSNVLSLARRLDVKSMVYLSSMEVYGSISSGQELVTEEELGDIDIANPRNSYSLGKRMAEGYCYSYYYEYKVPVKVARLAQTFGKGVLPNENRIFAQFARAIINKENIILHTNGESMGNYVDVGDALDGILLLLFKGINGQAYNVVNESNTMRIKDMANLVASEFGEGKIKVIYDIPSKNKYGYAQSTGLRLSSHKLMDLGWHPKKDIVQMYEQVIECAHQI